MFKNNELFRFLTSLCKGAFCSGFLELPCPVSCGRRVYSQGLKEETHPLYIPRNKVNAQNGNNSPKGVRT